MENNGSEIKRRCWQPAETRAFLVSYLARKDEFENPRKRKDGMKNILEDLEALGVLTQPTTEEMLRQKLKNLLRVYKSSIDNSKKTGASYSPPPFKDLMDDIFGKSPVILKGTLLSLGVQTTAQPLPIGKRSLETALLSSSPTQSDDNPSPCTSPAPVAASASLLNTLESPARSSSPSLFKSTFTVRSGKLDQPKTSRKQYYLKWKEMQQRIKQEQKDELLQRIEANKAKRHQEQARADISGPTIRYLTPGSTLRLLCRVLQNTESTEFIFWYHDNRMINYDIDRGINVSTEADFQSSELTISQTRREHSGNYTCVASNAQPDSVLVHIFKGDNPAAMYHGHIGSSTKSYHNRNLACFMLAFLLGDLMFLFHVIRI